jgi:tRNA pseudouridine13 synthase
LDLCAAKPGWDNNLAMKLKQEPEDFQVEELTDVAPGQDGPFALYRLEKKGWTTPDALAAIRRRWRVDHRRISYGGLKDRHAWTWQFLTIFRGPQRNLTHERIAVTFLGKVAEPFTSHNIAANRFRLTLRALLPAEIEAAQQPLDEVRRQGVPNYFDDQRFGSVGSQREFVAKAMIRGEFEHALRLALMSPYEYDRAPQKKEKSILRGHWGDWATCLARLPRGHARSLAAYLRDHPADFRGALDRLRPELRGLYLSAYQSHLWNRMLGRWLGQHVPADSLVDVPLRLGNYPMHRVLADDRLAELAGLALPLPSARMQLDAADPRRSLVDAVLAEEGLTLEQMRLKGMQMFFSRGERPALCLPADLKWESAADENHPGKRKLLLSFDLPRGCYATLLVKRITHSRSPAPHASMS